MFLKQKTRAHDAGSLKANRSVTMRILRPIPSADKPPSPPPPGTWETWALAILATLYRASESRVRRLELFNAQLAAEVDSQRRGAGQRRRAA